jgi:hypothetical protein
MNKPTAPASLPGIKVHCEQPQWSRKLQLVLRDAIGASWGCDSISIPWNATRPYLVVQQGPAGNWFLSWATPTDFEKCPLVLYSARELVKTWQKMQLDEARRRRPRPRAPHLQSRSRAAGPP